MPSGDVSALDWVGIVVRNDIAMPAHRRTDFRCPGCPAAPATIKKHAGCRLQCTCRAPFGGAKTAYRYESGTWVIYAFFRRGCVRVLQGILQHSFLASLHLQ